MKKILLATTLIMFTLSAQASIWGAVASAGWREKSTTKYKLNVSGWDVRVYEWIPEDNEDVRCVFLAGSENSTGVACYDVKGGK